MELRRDLQHHVVLVELGEHGRDLALPERVVQRVVDHRGRDPEARGSIAIDDQMRTESLVLLVGCHVAQRGQGLQPVQQLRGPGTQLGGIRILEAVLILRAAHAILDGQILHRLEIERDAFDLRELGLQAIDDRGNARIALVERFEIDENAAVVGRGIGAIDTDERGQALDRGILQDDVGELLLPLHHRGERHVLRRLGNALNDASVLHREKSLRHDPVEENRQDQSPNRNHQRRRLMLQDPPQSLGVEIDGR